MTWTPQFAATDVRGVVSNLFTFFASNQVAALAWASPSRLLAPLNLYRTAEVRMLSDFPHLGLVKRAASIDNSDDILKVQYDLTFEYEIAAEFTEASRSTALAQLQADSDNIGYAFESMILNIPDGTLLTGINNVGSRFRQVTKLDPLERAISNTKAVFNVEMQAAILLMGNPYSD